MAEKKKAYQRFEELTRRATTRPAPEANQNPGLPGNPEGPPADVVTVRLSPEVRRALVHHVRTEEASPSEIVEEALRRYLDLR